MVQCAPIWRQFSHTAAPFLLQCVLRAGIYLTKRAWELFWIEFAAAAAREDSIHCCRSTKDENTAHRCAIGSRQMTILRERDYSLRCRCDFPFGRKCTWKISGVANALQSAVAKFEQIYVICALLNNAVGEGKLGIFHRFQSNAHYV